MLVLKPLTPDAIPRALEKAERYRLLNEPAEAESICEDVLAVEPDNQEALVALLLALTEQFDDAAMGGRFGAARDLLPRLDSDYDREYYAGIIAERHGKAKIRRGGPSASTSGHESVRDAMRHYETAEALRPAGNDDARLRWNACARLLMREHADVEVIEERFEPLLE